MSVALTVQISSSVSTRLPFSSFSFSLHHSSWQFMTVHDSSWQSSQLLVGFLELIVLREDQQQRQLLGNQREIRETRKEIKRSKQLIAISSNFLAVLRAKSSQKSNCRVQVAEIFSWLHIRDMALRQCSETFRDFTKLRSHTSHTHSCEAVRGMWVSNGPSIFLLMCQPNVSLASSVTRLFCFVLFRINYWTKNIAAQLYNSHKNNKKKLDYL